MDAILEYAFQNGALNNVILSGTLVWIMWFVTRHYWPYRVEHCSRKQEIEKGLKEREIDSKTEIKRLEMQKQIDIYSRVVTNLDSMNMSIIGLQTVFSDFLQNILQQFLEDRKDLMDNNLLTKTDGNNNIT